MHKCTLLPILPKFFARQPMRKCRKNNKEILSLGRRPNEQRARLFSTSTKRSATSQANLTATKHEALTLQHKIEKSLESVFKVAEKPLDTRTRNAAIDFWRDVLSDTFENLSTGAERPARIVVYSMDEWSGAEDLVTALLDEPLSSDQNHPLQKRWKDASSKEGLVISAKPIDSSLSTIHLSSPYLRQFSVPLEITELRASGIPETLPSTLFKADVPIIVFNPLKTPLFSLEHLMFPSHTLLVASAIPFPNNISSVTSQLFPEYSQLRNSSLRILPIDPSRALSAIQIFRSNPTSALSIQQYQDNYNGSGIFHLTNVIRSVVDSGKTTSSPSAYLRNQTAIIQLHDALRAFYSIVENVQKSLDDTKEGVSQLTFKIEEAKVRVPNNIYFGQSASTAQAGRKAGEVEKEKDIVGESLKLSSKEIKGVLERLSWWKTIWRADEVNEIVGGAVDRVWCKDLEQKLILQTGRLLSLQKKFTTSAFLLLNTQLPTSPLSPNVSHPLFLTNILKNSLSQLTSSPTTYTLTPATLTSPITKRKHQLLAYPTTRLHLRAQRLVLSLSSTVALSSGFTWAGWMGYLSQSVINEPSAVGSAIWSTIGMGMDPVTGIGIGLLGAVGSLRWTVGEWEKEKKRWWTDWERIGKGLERDLKALVDAVMKDRVVVAADAACKGLEELCEKRQEEVDKTRDEVVELQNQLKDITSRAQQL